MNIYKTTRTLRVVLLMLGTSSIASCQPPQASHPQTFIQGIADSLSQGEIESPNLNMMGREPIPSQQYRRYETLKDSATLEELAQLTNHSSAVVCCYAFDALSERKAPNFFQLVQSHLTDSANIRVHFFDVVSYVKVSDYLKKGALCHYFETSVPEEAQYSVVRDFATTKEVPEAIIALARFRKAGDEEVIISYFDDARLRVLAATASREFPSARLFPKLSQLHRQELSRDLPSLLFCVPLYEALVQYKVPETLSMLSTSLTEPQEFAASIHKVSIYVALTKYPDKFYQGIIDHIKLSPEEKKGVDEILKE
jgi:hypothetical protein